MSGFSTYLENATLSWVKGSAFPSPPSATYVALFSSDPTDAGLTAAEVTATVRPAGRVVATFGPVSARTISNSADVDFGAAAGGASVSHYGVFDAAAAGNLLFSGPLTGGPQTINTGNPVKFETGALSLSVD